MITKRILIRNFWPPYLGDGNPRLFSDEIGWREVHCVDSHSNDTYHNFDFFINHYGFDLILYYLERDEFIYFDVLNGGVFLLQQREDWDGQYIFDRCEFTNEPDYDFEYIYEFDDSSQLWREFAYDGKNLKALIEASVVDLQH